MYHMQDIHLKAKKVVILLAWQPVNDTLHGDLQHHYYGNRCLVSLPYCLIIEMWPYKNDTMYKCNHICTTLKVVFMKI